MTSSTGRLTRLSIHLRSSFWFVPALMVVAGVVLGLGLVEADQLVDRRFRGRWPGLFGAEAEGSRAILSAIASSMITVAGVVFSITIVALAQASTQYTSRVLRNFMRDRANQVVLGVFLGVFSYCLVVLRAINTVGDDFVPALGVLGGVVLALAAIGFLIFFIHHIAAHLQSGEIAAGIARDTLAVIERSFPMDCGDDDAPAAGVPPGATWQPVPSPAMGYIQGVDREALSRLARDLALTVRMQRCVGEFVGRGWTLACVMGDRPPDDAVLRSISGAYAIGSFRSTEQDVAFGIRQLVDIALKALSPAINDTTTATTALDYLVVVLQKLASRRLDWPPDELPHGLLGRDPDFAALVALAFDQILENARHNTVVLVRLCRAIGQVAEVTGPASRRAVLASQLEALARSVAAGPSPDTDPAVHAQLARTRLALVHRRPGVPG